MQIGSEVVRLAELAEEQWGMFTTAQSRALGVTPQRLADLAHGEHLIRIRHGVYRIPGAPPDPQDELRAAWLLTDPQRTVAERLDDTPADPVISHRTAAQLWSIGDLDADRFEMTSPRRRQSRDRSIRYRKGLLAADQVMLLNGLPVTTVVATITDLAETGIDGSHLGTVISDALAAGLTTRIELGQALGPYAHQYRAPLGNGPAVVDMLAPADAPVAAPTPNLPWGDIAAQIVKAISNPSVQESFRRASAAQMKFTPAEWAAMRTATAPVLDQTDGFQKAMAQIRHLGAPSLTAQTATLDALRLGTADAQRDAIRKGLARTVDSVQLPQISAELRTAMRAADSVSPREIEANRRAAAGLQKPRRKPAK